MASLLHNAAANQALTQLRTINKGLENTQRRISTGKRVMDASDSVAFYSSSVLMNSDKSAAASINESLNMAISTVTTYMGSLQSIQKNLATVKDLLVQIRDPSANTDAIKEQVIGAMQAAFERALGSTVNGENWLAQKSGAAATAVGAPATGTYTNAQVVAPGTGVAAVNRSLVTSVYRSGGTMLTGSVNIDISQYRLVETNALGTNTGQTHQDRAGILDRNYYVGDVTFLMNGTVATSTVDPNATSTTTPIKISLRDFFTGTLTPGGTTTTWAALSDSANANNRKAAIQYSAVVDNVLDQIAKLQQNLGAVKNRLDAAKEFNAAYQDTAGKAIDAMIGADMEEESSRQKALQLQQSLSTSALNMANNSTSNLLTLFRD